MSQELERVYTINLGKVKLSQSQHRAVRAINMIREFARHHMKVETIKIEEELAQQIWSKGVRSPPRKVRVRMTKTDEGFILVSRYDEEAESKSVAENKSEKSTDKTEVPEPTKSEDAPKPSEPTKSEDAPKPSEPTKSEDAPKPSEPTKSEDAPKPSEPTKSEDAPKPSEPTKSEDAPKPSEPTKSEDAPKPSEPTKSEDAPKPSEPTKSEDAPKPSEPTKETTKKQ